jgi:hypothetical protein
MKEAEHLISWERGEGGAFKLTVNQRHPWSISTPGAHARKIAVQKLGAAYLQTLLDNLRCKLIHAIVNRPKEDMLNSTASIVRSTMFANMLDTPISELAMGEHVNFGYHFFNGRSLDVLLAWSLRMLTCFNTFSSSTQFSKIF